MDKNNFISEMRATDAIVAKSRMLNIIKKSVDSNLKDGNPRGHRNLIIVMEELAELGQAVSKELRGKGDYHDLLEEMADVQLCIYYLQEICGIKDEELYKALTVKTNRIDNVLNTNGEYK